MSQVKISEDAKNGIIIVVVVVALIILWKFGKGLSGMFDGVKDIFGAGTEAKNVDKAIKARDKKPKKQDPFSPEYIKSRIAAQDGQIYKLLTGSAKKKLIARIQDTGGFWRLFPETGTPLLELFKTLLHKSQVSDLANHFQQSTGKDMLTYIKGRLQNVGWLGQTERNTHLSELIDYVNNLPE